jgi:hypothetical protein
MIDAIFPGGEAMQLTDQDRETLIRLEECMWREETRFDLAFMQAALAPDFYEFGRSGRTWTREQTLAMPRGAFEALLPLPNLHIRLIDTNSAQLTCDSALTCDGATEHGHRSSIW